MTDNAEKRARPGRAVWNYTPTLPLRPAPYWDWPMPMYKHGNAGVIPTPYRAFLTDDSIKRLRQLWAGSRRTAEAQDPKEFGMEQRQANKLKPLVGKLALDAGVDILPVYIDGAYRVMPKGRMLPLPLLCTLSFGKPLVATAEEGKEAFLERARMALLDLAPEEEA